ncbi:zinc ribbon domain-containing protein [Eggerthellaceae bacterium zg-997]|nr:zinc ribbon domain-containing protein [Eggerthellaceae bacterium zg-997]
MNPNSSFRLRLQQLMGRLAGRTQQARWANGAPAFGRVGIDDLGRFLIGVSVVLMVAGLFPVPYVRTVSLVMVVVALLRALSRNHMARGRENRAYLDATVRPRAWFRLLDKRWTNRATTRYPRCPHCRKVFAVPKGKGRIRATCPHCHEQSMHTT